MAIIKPVYEIPYAQIPNKTLQDMSLSHTARSILFYLLSKPDNWKISKESLRKQMGIGSNNTMQKYVNELKKAGYLSYEKTGKKGNLNTYDWYVYPEPQNQLQPTNTKGVSGDAVSGRPEKVRRTKTASLTNKELTNKESKSVSNTREAQKFETDPANLADRVMAELLADNLPANKKRYASLKIREYQERFPESASVADCWAYVVQAVSHQHGLTGS